MLLSLNAIRVLAEFWVVHQHLAPYCGGGKPMVVDLLTRDLMCFFFVLSGFVMTYAHRNDDLGTLKAKTRFWWRRFSKLYPVFLFFWVVSFVLYATGPEWKPHDLPCKFLQLGMLTGWIGCRANLINCPSWYVVALWWMWFVFPLASPVVKRFGGRWPWVQILGITLVELAIITPLRAEGYWLYAPLPALRFLEFYIGCVAATTVGDGPVFWVWPAGAMVLFVSFHVLQYYVLGRNGGCFQTDCSTCDNTLTEPCLLAWSYAYTNKFAPVWALIIHWLAASELREVPGRAFLFLEESRVLQVLSTFSLQLYLGHWCIFQLLQAVSAWVGMEGQWEINTVFVAVYWLSYQFKVHAQPVLDRTMERVWNSTDCAADAPLQPSTSTHPQVGA